VDKWNGTEVVLEDVFAPPKKKSQLYIQYHLQLIRPWDVQFTDLVSIVVTQSHGAITSPTNETTPCGKLDKIHQSVDHSQWAGLTLERAASGGRMWGLSSLPMEFYPCTQI
jgi:hypothetical protein